MSRFFVKGLSNRATPLRRITTAMRVVSEDWLFHGKDEVGREGWFVRIEVTGMYPRRYGPFAAQEDACEFLEDFLHDLMEPFGDLERDLDRPEQICVVEGVPRLVATTNER